jgi:hypothetical protein
MSRTFTTNAASVLLQDPSTPPEDLTTETIDTFATWTLGLDGLMTVSSAPMRLLASVRFDPLTLGNDRKGRRVRLLGGVVWTLR